MLGLLLVELGVGLVSVLVDLVSDGGGGSVESGSDGGVGVLGDLLVGLLGGLSSEALDGLGNVVGGLLRKRKEEKRQESVMSSKR